MGGNKIAVVYALGWVATSNFERDATKPWSVQSGAPISLGQAMTHQLSLPALVILGRTPMYFRGETISATNDIFRTLRKPCLVLKTDW